MRQPIEGLRINLSFFPGDSFSEVFSFISLLCPCWTHAVIPASLLDIHLVSTKMCMMDWVPKDSTWHFGLMRPNWGGQGRSCCKIVLLPFHLASSLSQSALYLSSPDHIVINEQNGTLNFLSIVRVENLGSFYFWMCGHWSVNVSFTWAYLPAYSIVLCYECGWLL